MISLHSPQEMPDPGEIDRIEEPYLKAKILIPPDYVGAVMELTTARRGTFVTMNYLSPTTVEMLWEIPLSELIMDYFDKLKSNTKGYASLDYDFDDYKPSKLVKLDILLSGKPIDALSFIVHKDKAYDRGRVLTEKLKEIIPRQMFEVPIQAAIGGLRAWHAKTISIGWTTRSTRRRPRRTRCAPPRRAAPSSRWAAVV